MDIQSASAPGTTAATSAASAAANRDRTTLGQDEFMRMLITQLEHQDPLEPQDPTEFTAQLAQFSTLEQLTKIREGIDGLRSDEGAFSDVASLAGLVGRDVVIRSSMFEVDAGGAVPGLELDLAAPAEAVRVRVLNAAGIPVRTFDLGSLSSGRHALAWDGLASDGTPVPPGTYELRAESVSGANSTRLETLVHGTVDAVEPLAGGGASITVGPAHAASDAIVEVRRTPEPVASAPAVAATPALAPVVEPLTEIAGS